jgi:hypothetical protein
MACFTLVGPPLAARLLRRSTRHVTSDDPTSNKDGDASGSLWLNRFFTLGVFNAKPAKIAEKGLG